MAEIDDITAAPAGQTVTLADLLADIQGQNDILASAFQQIATLNASAGGDSAAYLTVPAGAAPSAVYDLGGYQSGVGVADPAPDDGWLMWVAVVGLIVVAAAGRS